MRDHVSELRDGQKETRGGSSETDVSEFTIRPAGSPSGAAVMKATPVANLASASRNERASRAGATLSGAASAISMEGRRFAEGDAAEGGRSVEQPGDQVALHVGQRVAGSKASAHTGLGQLDTLERDRVAAGGAHSQRVPVIVHDDATSGGGNHRVRVALDALAVGVGNGDVEIGGGGGHRAEHLADVDSA